MTLKERFVGGNPRVLLLLFCLLYVGTNPHVQDDGDDGGDE